MITRVVKYVLDSNTAIGVALTREQFKKYCKPSQ